MQSKFIVCDWCNKDILLDSDHIQSKDWGDDTFKDYHKKCDKERRMIGARVVDTAIAEQKEDLKKDAPISEFWDFLLYLNVFCFVVAIICYFLT